jgi:hypothetical protein
MNGYSNTWLHILAVDSISWKLCLCDEKENMPQGKYLGLHANVL